MKSGQVRSGYDSLCHVTSCYDILVQDITGYFRLRHVSSS
jgi:hypothetical protein